MKNNLRFTFLLIAFAITHLHAQVTKLSNNTSLSGIVLNNKVILESQVNHTLWTTDGTPVGTLQYTTKVTFDSLGGASILGNKIYFGGSDPINGSELWVTDGSDAGTALIKDIEPGASSSTPSDFFTFNNGLLFFAKTAASGIELWKTDGTTAGTVMVKDINPGPGSSVDSSGYSANYFSNNGIVYFAANDGTHGRELWRTDGTTSGTIMVKDINPGPGNGIGGQFSFGTTFTALGTLTLFTADDGTTGEELWETDGTAAGTMLVKDINPGIIASSPREFVTFNNKIYFSANTLAEGNELWSTDGTAAGTNLVKDIYPGSASSSPLLVYSIIFGSKLVFPATDSAHGRELWSTDGTEAGTALLKDINPGIAGSNVILLPDFRTSALSFVPSHTPPFNGKAFMVATTPAEGTELWITDGTAAGTVLVKDINPGTGDGVAGFIFPFYTGNGLFFSAQQKDSSLQPWKSDGSAAGTALLATINPTGSSDPSFDFVYNSHLYMTANDGDNGNGLTDLYVFNQTVTALPITLFNFAATVQPSKAVQLNWSTTNEINSSHFDIERSADGINFSAIDKVKAAGNSGLMQRYQYTDYQPAHLYNPILYYRLKMVDKDAASKYSQVLEVHFKESSFRFTFSPNPVQNQLSVIVAAGGSKSVALRITDASGKQVYQQTLSSSQNIVQQNINVAGWQTGVYYIQLITDNSIKSSKFIKQ